MDASNFQRKGICEYTWNLLCQGRIYLESVSEAPALQVKNNLQTIDLSVSLLDDQLWRYEAHPENLVRWELLRIPLTDPVD